MNFASNHKALNGWDTIFLFDMAFVGLMSLAALALHTTSSGFPIKLPHATPSNIVVLPVRVNIDYEGNFFINRRPVHEENLDGQIRNALGSGNAGVLIHVTKNARMEKVLSVLDICDHLGVSVTIATSSYTDE